MPTYTLYSNDDSAFGDIPAIGAQINGVLAPTVLACNTWQEAHDDTVGFVMGAGSSSFVSANMYTPTEPYNYRPWRSKFGFSGSSVVGTVTSAILSIYVLSKDLVYGNPTFHVVSGVNLNQANTVVADFYAMLGSTTSYGSIAYSSLVNSAYNDITINQAGIDEINDYLKSGKFIILGGRGNWDIENIPVVNNVNEYQFTYGGDVYAGQDYYTKLTLVATGATNEPVETEDRVTGIVYRFGVGHYSQELKLGGLSTNWDLVSMTKEPLPAVPSQAKGTIYLGRFYEITGKGMVFYDLYKLPDGTLQKYYLSQAPNISLGKFGQIYKTQE